MRGPRRLLVGLLLVAALNTLLVSGRVPAAGVSDAVAAAGVSDGVVAGQLGDVVSGMHPVLVGGASRSYRWVSSGQPDARVPLLVVLHGRGQTLPAALAATGFLGLARGGRVALVFPLGEQRSWNAGLGCCGASGARARPDATFLAAVVADALRRLPVDPRRVYLVGYSNGGKLAYSEACAHPRLFAAVATYGAVPLAPCPGGTPAVPYLLAAGSADPLLPVDGRPGGRPPLPAVRDALGWLRTQDGCAAAAQERRVGTALVRQWRACRVGGEVESVLYLGRGHGWPGAGAVGELAAAATLMWTFLSRHTAPATSRTTPTSLSWSPRAPA